MAWRAVEPQQTFRGVCRACRYQPCLLGGVMYGSNKPEMKQMQGTGKGPNKVCWFELG